MRDVLSSSWTAVVEVVLMFAAEAVKEELGAAVCHGEPGLGVPPPPHHSPSCLPVMRNDNPEVLTVLLSCQLSCPVRYSSPCLS